MNHIHQIQKFRKSSEISYVIERFENLRNAISSPTTSPEKFVENIWNFGSAEQDEMNWKWKQIAYSSGFQTVKGVPRLGHVAIFCGTRERSKITSKISSFQWWIDMNDPRQEVAFQKKWIKKDFK